MWLRRICLLAAVFISGTAHAVDYTWASYYKTGYPDPVSACMDIGNFSPNVPSYAVKRDEYQWKCYGVVNGKLSGATLPIVVIGDINRQGNGCALPKVYNSETGVCGEPEPDKCESTTGYTEHEHDAGEIGGAYSEPPGTLCQGGCQYAFTFEAPKDVYRYDVPKEGKKTGHAYYKYRYKGNGTSCTESANPAPGSVFDQPMSKPPMDTKPTAFSESKCGEWTAGADGTATRTCTATDSYRDPGKMNCANSGGTLVCNPGNPSPNHTEKKSDVETTKTTNPDGSSTTTSTTTTTNTSCLSTNPCTWHSSTTTTKEGTNPDGTEGDKESECTGDGCKEEDEEPESSVSGGESCDAAPACEGDAIQCAILKQQYEARCAFEEAQDYESHKGDIEALVQGEKFTLDEGSGSIDIPSFINKGTRFLPSTCPTAESFSLRTAGGRTFSLSYEPLCRAASDLSGLFVAVATVLCALYVGRSVGGQ